VGTNITLGNWERSRWDLWSRVWT